jgi:hypothetical protein
VDAKGEIASCATVWYDDVNRLGILEPVEASQRRDAPTDSNIHG